MFDRLVDNALSEVERRVPDYFARFGLTVPDLARTAEDYRFSYPGFRQYPSDEIERGLADGIAHVVRRGGRVA